ncbi:hypothetical protein CR513_36014, partial [Mucuna pruriens]
MCEDPSRTKEPIEDEGTKAEALVEMERRIEWEKPKFQLLTEELESINLGNEMEKKEVRVGKQMSPDLRMKLMELLKEFADVFAWSYQDMPGLDYEIVEHKLPLLPNSVPVRRGGEVAEYSVPRGSKLPTMSGKHCTCTKERREGSDLNRASPKDNFPLPHIDTLVDNTAQHAFFSFMDGFSGYNQILMAQEDQEKTTFITLWGTFYYRVMPFGLKNMGATYQRAMVALFHDMMHKEIEVYVDDMIAKSKTPEQHIEDLRKLLRLNQAKCTFGVKIGKLLGFVVSERGIEVDSDKVRAIREMLTPKTNFEVRGFLGRPGSFPNIARFISQLTTTCNPIFKLLRKKQKLEWDSKSQKAFEKIKRYLENPPALIPTIPRRPLILYLMVLDESMGCMLGQRDEMGRKERVIYYLSKKFTDCDKRYSALERTCCALV